jgi:thymidylate kinase
VFTGLVISDDPLIKATTDRFIRPDVCFLADVSVETAYERIHRRPDQKDKRFDSDEIRRDIARYRNVAAEYGFVVVETEADIAHSEELVRDRLDLLLDPS